MAGFLYLIPEQLAPAQVTPELISKYGLSYAFERKPTVCGCQNLPAEIGGGLWTTLGDPQAFAHKPVSFEGPLQTWRKIPKSKAFIGFYNDAPPTPEELIRSRTLPGRELEMGDGRNWLIPIARRFDMVGGSLAVLNTLPARPALNDDGDWVSGEVLPQYRHLDDLAQAVFDLRYGAANSPLVAKLGSMATAQVISEVLSVNYKLSAIEVSILGLVTDLVWQPLGSIIIDEASYHEIKKKEVVASSSS